MFLDNLVMALGLRGALGLLHKSEASELVPGNRPRGRAGVPADRQPRSG